MAKIIVKKPIVRSIPKIENLINGYTRKVKWTCIVEPCEKRQEKNTMKK